jgi:serine/threonine-protein kinase
MTDDSRIQQLLDELANSQATPEEVCATCPELLGVVRDRWRQMRRLRADLDALFPSPTEPTPQHSDGLAVPQIPGYEVEALLGRGGMGVVFKGRHLKLNRPVALKMLLAGAYAGPEELARFRREAEAVAALRHPNIVQVHDAGESAGRPYFTMECVEGGSLAHSLAGKPSPPRRAAELVATLASAVQFAHQSGFIHRDLKPANVLLAADGTPKITDFGLVRSLHTGPAVTQSGACLGTPSYMAPEQALGHASAVGPAVDIYALGVVLYEMLTGRPPFDGQTAVETLQKVIAEEPTPPSRLNAQVPRDLETICLKCLQKGPARRYASAQDLADDLHRFLDGMPVLARPVGLFERAAKWARRRPVAALLVGALLVLLGAAAGTGVWLQQQEADRQAAKAQREGQAREALETALRRADNLRREERWQEALVVLVDASPHLAEANAPLLGKRLRQALSDFRSAAKLEVARESNPRLPDGTIDYRRWAAEFLEAFTYAGLRIDEDVETIAASLRASTIRAQLVAAIEHRAFVAIMLKEGPLVERLLRIARSADPEPVWRDHFRDPAAWKNQDHLLQLAAGAFTSSPAPTEHQLALLGLLLNRVGSRNEGIRLLGEACRRQPKNFWVNREMGFALVLEKRWLESAGYYRAALTLRPDNAGAHEGLGLVLASTGQIEEALTAYRRAVELSPKTKSLHTRLVVALANAGYWKAAEAACRRALEIDPGNHFPPYRLGDVLVQHGRLEDAVVLYRQAAEIAPNDAEPQVALGALCARTGRHEEAVTAFRKVVELKAWHFAPEKMLAQELAATGRWEEAIEVLATAAAREPKFTWFHLEAGKLLRSHGKPEEAARAFEEATTTAPYFPLAWEGLLAARLDQGDFIKARAAAVALLKLIAKDSERRARQRHLDLCDALLAIAADLPAILAGQRRPAQAAAQLALAAWCLKHKRLTATAADFYATALAAQPALADDLGAGHRIDAARAAALAGCGVGKDATRLADLRRAELRKQALAWLTADYEVWAERHRAGKAGDRTVAVTAVRSWVQNEDLAGVRDEQALAKLPADERRAWQALWVKVATFAARDPAAKFDRARAHVARREWAKAVQCYAKSMKPEPTDKGEIWFEYAAAQLLAGDRQGYRRTCAHMLARCESNPAMIPHLAARAYTLAPDSTGVPTPFFRQIANELSRRESEYWALTALGAWHLRVGRSRDTVAYFERSLAADGRPGRAVLNWLWLALAHQKLGRADDARRWLDKAANWLDQQGGRMPVETREMGSHRHNWLEAHVLRQEAEALLSPR